MLGVSGIKGCLDAGADADLVVLSEHETDADADAAGDGDGAGDGEAGRRRELVVDEVWKFGVRVFSRT